MTATYPARTGKAYRGVVYGIDLLDHASVMADAERTIRDDYVGKTRQRGRGRENQHRDDKPWADLIVGSSHVLWEGICDEGELDQRERDLIREKRPRMNDKDNRWNRDRIDFDAQVAQRHDRDRKFGRPLWQPPGRRRRDSLLEWETPDQPAYERDSPVRQKPSGLKPSRLTRGQRFAVGWGVAWLGSTLAGWLLALHWHLAGRQAVIAAVCLLPAVLVLLDVALRWTVSHWTRRRWWRRMIGCGR